jgi:putative transposase
MDDKAEKIAFFRYGLIAPLVLETLPRGELTRRAQEITARLYDIPCSTRRQVSVDTLLEWTLRYRRNGLAALTPNPAKSPGRLSCFKWGKLLSKHATARMSRTPVRP